MSLQNPWIGYFDRTYEQLRDNILTIFQDQVPEITDHTETNPWVKGISIWAAMMEMLGYYLDNAAREVYITQSKQYASAVKIAKQFDYRIKAAQPSSVTLTFTSNVPATADITIPQFTEVQTELGIRFLTIETGTILAGETTVEVQARQQFQVSSVNVGTSDGSTNQTFELEAKVADGSVTALVGSTPFTAQDTFSFSLTDDNHFVAGINENQVVELKFGDALNGAIPNSGDDIIVTYMITEGSGGNVGAALINTINSTITVPGSEQLSVNNALQANGGADLESLSTLRTNVPLTIRTKDRAVTRQDFIDITQTYSGVVRAGVLYDQSVDTVVGIYIAPEGGGLASDTLLADVTTFLNLRKIITVPIIVSSVGEVFFNINVSVVALSGFSNATVKAAVETALLDFFDVSNQEISGKVLISDLYQVIEAVSGVDNSAINSFIMVPHARPLNNSVELPWTRTLKAASASTIKWEIRFTGTNTFELRKDDVFEGNYTVGVLVDLTELSFTISSNNTSGNNYEFYTYAYNANVTLTEPSIASTELSRLTVSVTGGV